MKNYSYISRAFGLLMFTMVMLTSVFGKQLPQQKHDKPNKPKQEKSDKKQQSDNQSVVSELSLEVVVPSHAFDFNHDALILPTPQVIYLNYEKKAKIFTKPVFILSYFENLYEHFIAPNAP
ncbi:MAG: hypothetical protein U5M51_15135 [Emticicia sp.]|nr:hypothetical protein [Emticicia sp.]